MNKSCKYCGRIHQDGYECPAKPKRKRFKNDSEASRLRQTNAYRKLRAEVKERDHLCCRYCFFVKHKMVTKSLEVHHIIPIAERPEYYAEERNLVTLCRACHEKAEAGLIPKKELQALIRKVYDYTKE